MMLGEMQAVEARLVGRLDEVQPLVEQLRGGAFAVLDVVEKSDFHFSFSSNLPIFLMTGISRLASASTNFWNSGWSR